MTGNEEAVSLELFRALVEASRDVVTIVDPDGTILYASPSSARTVGYRPEDMVGRNAFLDIHTDDVSRVKNRLDEILSGISSTAPVSFRFRHRDGSWKVFEAVGTNRTKDPAVGGVVLSSRDVTRLRNVEESMLKLEEQFRQAQRMEAVGRLAGGVAHDFNNLLTAILGYTEILAGKIPAGSPLQDEVEEIRRAGESASELTRRLLAFSRKQLLEPKILNLNDVAASLRSILQRLIGENLTLVTNFERRLGNVRADALQIEQVILNLVVNAKDAMPDGGTVTIETRNVELDGEYARQHINVEPGAYIQLAVSDTGIGMNAETAARVFEPFFTTKEPGKGTGMGLATVYGIVKQSGGAIWVYSEPGRGTTFKVYLPRVEGAAESIRRGPAPPPRRGTETVLLVEDDPSVRALTRRILGLHGYRVIESAGAADALDLAQTHSGTIHLLLTDVVMPEISGSDLAARIHKTRPLTRVLYMSGYTDDAAVQLGLIARTGSFLQKPFTPTSLIAKIREVLDT
jgi:PAS domain S-box-containing protein